VGVFGSIAKGLDTEASDVDILVIADNRETANECVAEANTALMTKFGLGLSPLIMDPRRFIRSQNSDLTKSIKENYRMVWGRDIKDLVKIVEASR
jgi:predicted nucleotidyltransferase